VVSGSAPWHLSRRLLSSVLLWTPVSALWTRGPIWLLRSTTRSSTSLMRRLRPTHHLQAPFSQPSWRRARPFLCWTTHRRLRLLALLPLVRCLLAQPAHASSPNTFLRLALRDWMRGLRPASLTRSLPPRLLVRTAPSRPAARRLS
jgi:hypothetical protein